MMNTKLENLGKKSTFPFPLGIQLVLPDNYLSEYDFLKTMDLLQELGFSCIELNIADPAVIDPTILKDFLRRFGLTMTMFASGVSARVNSLNLSDFSSKHRKRAVKLCKEYIDFCSEMETGIILGLIQGPPVANPQAGRERFCDSLDELVPFASERNVILLVEATNRTLTSIANTADQTKELISRYPVSIVRMLLDTFHMSLEENDLKKAIVSHSGDFDSIHYSDDNRYYPGLGKLDFKEITETLLQINFTGPIVLEANIRSSLDADLRISLGYLSSILF